jgi:hypothetical protein
LAGEAYLGFQQQAAEQCVNTNHINGLVKRLVEPWMNTGRNITTDKYFTSVTLAEDRLGVQTTLVGTIRQNIREIPGEL